MKRITISLPDDLAARVEREARRNRTSVSDVVRRSLAERLTPVAEGGKRNIPFAGLFSSGHTDTSEKVDEILAEIYEARHVARTKANRDG